MNVKKFEFSSEEREEILKEYQLNHPVRAYKRLLALKLKAIDGMRSEEVAKIVGIEHSTVNKIINRYKAEGMQAIVGKRHIGEHRYMTNEQEEAFLAPFVALAKEGKIIEITDIYNAYQEAIGHPATRNAIYYILEKHGWRKIMPRGRHPKKASGEAIAAYKKISEEISELKRMRQNLRVMFQDEAGFGRINKPKRCWCPKGMRPSVPCHHVREYRYLYGAVSPQDGELFTLVLPYANTVCMNVFLEELSRKYPDNYILLVLDNAAWHHSGTLVVPENIRLYPLLPYTPELNPIEMIWDEIREKGFRNEIFATLDKVIDRLCLSVKNLMDHPERVASITHRKWLIDALLF